MYTPSTCSTKLTLAQVDSPHSLENVETKWVAEIAENCPGVKLVLVALKCDLRKRSGDEDNEDESEPEKPTINYEEGLKVAEKIKALRYLGMIPEYYRYTFQWLLTRTTECSAMKNRGVNEAFTEAARVALQVKSSTDQKNNCTIM